MTDSVKTQKIYAYGFEQKDFLVPQEAIRDKNYEIEFLNFEDTHSLNEADGVIIPQGIFEMFDSSHVPLVGTSYHAKVKDSDLLLQREKELLNLLEKGGWVCFLLLEAIIDKLPSNNIHYHDKDISSYDLCKRLLNRCRVYRNLLSAEARINTHTNEFINYMEKFGIAKTYFDFYYCDKNLIYPIASTESNRVISFAYNSNSFFLPFHSVNKDKQTLNSLTKLIVESILDFRRRIDISIPEWAHQFKFSNEESLISEINEHKKEIINLEKKLVVWENYKSILCFTGNLLCQAVINVLESYFGLNIDPADEGKEDFKIINSPTEIIALSEVKGTDGSVKRPHINQLDSSRDLHQLTTAIPGVLIINNEMGIEDLNSRAKTKIPSEQIDYARSQNILIIRTIDLLYLMKLLESKSVKARGQELIRLINSGGGWLKVSEDKIELITSSEEIKSGLSKY